MTREDYIEMCVKKARTEAMDVLVNHLQPFNQVGERFTTSCMTRKRFNEILSEMKKPIKE